MSHCIPWTDTTVHSLCPSWSLLSVTQATHLSYPVQTAFLPAHLHSHAPKFQLMTVFLNQILEASPPMQTLASVHIPPPSIISPTRFRLAQSLQQKMLKCFCPYNPIRAATPAELHFTARSLGYSPHIGLTMEDIQDVSFVLW